MDEFDEAAVVYQIILTKADKVKKADQQALLDKTRKTIAKRPAAHPDLLLVSSNKGDGIAELRAQMAILAIADAKI